MSRLVAFALLGACASALSNSLRGVDDAAVLRGTAASGVQQLLSFYNKSTGEFGPPETIPFWTTANAVETLANYVALTNDTSVMPIISDVHDKAFARYCNCYRDDHLWYVLAWARVYAVTGESKYLDTAQAIFANITGPWHSWNLTCGGINWYSGDGYVNTITNTLFLSASTLLWELTGNTSIAGANFTYQGWSKAEFDWFASSPLQQPNGLFIDGLDTQDCSKTSGNFWTCA